MISAVFFDFSGTLVSSSFDIAACRNSVTRYLGSQGFEVTPEKYSSSVETCLADVKAARELQEETTYENFMRKVLSHLGIEASDSLIGKIEKIEFNNYYWKCFPNSVAILDELSTKYRLGLISNAMTSSAIDVLRDEHLLPYFEVIVLSRDVGFRKPHPAIFNSALKMLRVSAKESVFVGDNAGTDILGARRIGMSGVWISRGEKISEEGLIGDPFLGLASDLEEVPSAIRFLEELTSKEEMIMESSGQASRIVPSPLASE